MPKVKDRKELKSGHIFYLQRTDVIKLGDYSLEERKYNRVEDFGVVPLLFVEGYSNTVYEKFINELREKNVKVSAVRHIAFNGSIFDVVNTSRAPWMLYADVICQKYVKVEDITERTRLASGISTKKFFYMQDYAKYFIDFIEPIEEKEIKPVEFIVNNTSKEFSFLYDILYDAIEIVFWYNSYKGIEELHTLLDTILQEEIIAKISDIGGFYWKKGYVIDIENKTYLEKFVEAIKSNEQKRGKNKN